jgi:sulfatase maturation enzyme AslB (radical SAM superfamily)
MKDHSPDSAKFTDPFVTADGSDRAQVHLKSPQTLWFNTGTLCNITCANCYIDSSPVNDALIYLTTDEVTSYLDQLDSRNWGVGEIGFTGGEPFMNPQLMTMIAAALQRGYDVLVLTNAMRPMMRPRIQNELTQLNAAYPDKLTLRVSLDHFDARHHDTERGKGSFAISLQGMDWLRDAKINMAVAGRTMWGEDDATSRAGFAALFAARGYAINANDQSQCVLFPEMDDTIEVPEITSDCWGILNKSPDSVMCASSRMVVRRKGSEHATVLACTLLAYNKEFELGATLEQAERPVHLNHRHCAKFCVLGGASCA